jgi:hypothetical protein
LFLPLTQFGRVSFRVVESDSNHFNWVGAVGGFLRRVLGEDKDPAYLLSHKKR